MPSADLSPTPVTVVAAVIRNDAGGVLLTRRPAGLHMGGLWEFPGGKVEVGESPVAGLERELKEELAIAVDVGAPLTFAVHEEPGMCIVLLFFNAVIRKGPPRALEGQEIAWVDPEDLTSYPTPPADADLIERLSSGWKG